LAAGGRLPAVTAGEQKGISEAFFEALEVYRWPGNVRELVNALKILFLPVINP
jgi:transcriptional regulator with PAS, ATPase and Fis domain